MLLEDGSWFLFGNKTHYDAGATVVLGQHTASILPFHK